MFWLSLVSPFPFVFSRILRRSPSGSCVWGYRRGLGVTRAMCYPEATSGICTSSAAPQTAFSGCASRRVLYPLLPSQSPGSDSASSDAFTKFTVKGALFSCSPLTRHLQEYRVAGVIRVTCTPSPATLQPQTDRQRSSDELAMRITTFSCFYVHI